MPEADSAKASPTAGTVPHTNDNSSPGLIKPPGNAVRCFYLRAGLFFTARRGEEDFARQLRGCSLLLAVCLTVRRSSLEEVLKARLFFWRGRELVRPLSLLCFLFFLFVGLFYIQVTLLLVWLHCDIVGRASRLLMHL